eukprot:scaffold4498_cov119-Isochrysis_galbana.AAC.46
MAIRARMLAATRRLVGFGLLAWRKDTSKCTGGCPSAGAGTSIPPGPACAALEKTAGSPSQLALEVPAPALRTRNSTRATSPSYSISHYSLTRLRLLYSHSPRTPIYLPTNPFGKVSWGGMRDASDITYIYLLAHSHPGIRGLARLSD